MTQYEREGEGREEEEIKKGGRTIFLIKKSTMRERGGKGRGGDKGGKGK